MLAEELFVDFLESEIDGGAAAFQIEGRIHVRGHQHADVEVSKAIVGKRSGGGDCCGPYGNAQTQETEEIATGDTGGGHIAH